MCARFLCVCVRVFVFAEFVRLVQQLVSQEILVVCGCVGVWVRAYERILLPLCVYALLLQKVCTYND